MEQEMETIENENINIGRESNINEDQKKWVYDSSVDYKGNVPLRSSTGAWKASLFIITIEFSERLSYIGISKNLIMYLTLVMHQDLDTAAKNLNYWAGITTLLPLLGGFLADSYIGRFSTVLYSSFIYLVGLILLTMTQYVPSLKPCPSSSECERATRVHEAVFFLALYMISTGTGGHKPCLESFGADQFDDDHDTERKQKMSFFNWWSFAVCASLILGSTLIVYLQDNVSWGLSYVIITAILVTTIVIFVSGRPHYRYRVPQGSPLTPMLRVLVAAFRKRNLKSPSDPSLLYELPKSKIQGRLLCHTDRLGFLDKAAIIEDYDQYNTTSNPNDTNPWRLATLTQVEEVKLILSTIPIWLTSLTFLICVSQMPTFFIKQAAATDRTVSGGFKIPAASISSVTGVGMIATVVIYDRVLVPALRRSTGNERGIDILRRIGIGMAISMAAMSVAAAVEHRRLGLDPTVKMSVLWLVPQFGLYGVADGFTLVGLQEYFYDQVPDTMRSMGIALFLSISAVAHFLSNLLISVVDGLTEKNGSHGWIGKDLKTSRLDKFYWLLVVLSAFNFCAYMVVAKCYTYKSVERKRDDYDSGVEEI